MGYVVTAIIGFLGGITSGLFGVGGGLVFVPLLIIFQHYNPHLAIGTSLAVIVPTALVAAARNFKSGMIDWNSVFILVLFSMAGAWISSGISLKLDVGVLKKLYAAFLLGISVKMFFQN